MFFVIHFRSSHRKCSVKKVVLRNFAKFTGKHLCQRLFLIKLQVLGLRPATLLKKSLWYRCFPINFAKFLKTPFLQNTSGRLLLSFKIFNTIKWPIVHKDSSSLFNLSNKRNSQNTSPQLKLFLSGKK